MKNFIQPGNSVTLAMPYDRTAGQGVLVGALFGIATVDALNTVPAEVALTGVFDITKEPALAISAGARLFWDNTNRRVTTTATSNVAIGHCVAAALAADATVRVRLAGSTAAGT